MANPIFVGFQSLGDFLGSKGWQWPSEWFGGAVLNALLSDVAVVASADKSDQGRTKTQMWLAYAGEFAIDVAGLDIAQIVLPGSESSSTDDVPFRETPPVDPFDEALPLDFASAPSSDDTPIVYVYAEVLLAPVKQLFLPDLRILVRLANALLKGTADEGPLDIDLRGSIRIDETFGLSFDGFEAFELAPTMIGDSGVVISASDVKLDLSRTSSPPEVIAAGFDDGFLGVFVGNATVTLPGGMLGADAETITLTNAAIGSGGVSGTARLPHLAPAFVESTHSYDGPRAGALFGVPFWLTELDLTVKKNTFVEATIVGEMFMPFFEKRVQVQVGFDGNGGLLLQVAGGGGGTLFTVDIVTGVQFAVKSLTVEERAGKALFRVSTKLIMSNVGGLASWPSPEIDGLLIDSEGHVQVEGGWIDLPKQASLSLYGFTMELTKIGFGREDSGERWIGFSGGLKLVDGIKAGASVKGLRIHWTESSSTPSLSLEGVGIDFEIPDSLAVTGAVSLVGQNFAGAVKVVIKPISLTIEGQFVTGKTPQGDRYFGIFLDGELPAGIPLGATGLAIYGMAGLYGQNLAPGKGVGEDWFENPDGSAGWYLRSPVGITDLQTKWTPTSGAFALGAGITLGTYADNGYEFSGRMLLVISFPGPTILIDGRANLFRKRAELSSGDPMFRALAVIQPGQSFLLGLDAHYKYKDDGDLLDIKGSAEAFFDFTDASNWHIFIGRKDPKLNRRIAARLFKLFDVNSYFELTPGSLAMGAGWSFDKSYGFDSLNVHVQASMQTDATVSWHPNHITGSVTLDGGAELRAFGHGVGVHTHANITADVLQPFHLKGDFHVGIDLPWPLPDLGGTITLEWQERLTATPPLPLPLRDATVEHTKRMLKWPIPRGGSNGALLPDNNGSGDLEIPGRPPPATPPDGKAPIPAGAPRIPADSAIGLTFSRAVADGAGVGVNPTRVDKEIIGDPTSDPKRPVGAYTVEYQLSSVALEKRAPAPESVADLNDLGPRWVKVAEAHGDQNVPGKQQLFGAWSPAPPNDSDPQATSEQLKLLINAKTPFDYTAQQVGTWDTWFESASSGYPCQPAPDPNAKLCAMFTGLASLPAEGNELDFDDPAIVLSWPGEAKLLDSDSDIPGGGGSRRSLGVVGTLEEGDEVAIVPPDGFNKLFVRVGTALEVASLVSVEPFGAPLVGTTVVLDSVNIDVFQTSDPDADLIPGPRPNKVPVTPTVNSTDGLDVGDLTEITFPPATTALNVDVDVRVETKPEGSGGTDLPRIIVYTEDGERHVLEQTVGSHGFRLRFTGTRILRVAMRTGGGPYNLHLRRVHARTPVSAVAASREGSEIYGPFEEKNDVITVIGDDLGLIKLGTPRRCEFTITEICEPDRRLELNRHTISSLDLLAEDDAIFEPQADYRLVVTTRRGEHTTGRKGQGGDDASLIAEDIKFVEQAYFHVVAPPGIEAPDQPRSPPPPAEAGSTTGFENLGFYLKSTIPDSTPASDGKPVIPRAFYRAYDVSIAFNEPSAVEKMYRLARRDLTLRLFDTSNDPVLDATGRAIIPTTRWDTAQKVTLTDAEKRWVRMVNTAACRPSDIPVFDSNDAKTDQLVSGPGELLMLAETLYQARLVPALLHEAFVNALPGLAADGHHELERWFAVNSVAATPGRWVVGSADVIGPDGQPVIGPDGKHVQTFFATETTGHPCALIYRGPLGAPPAPDASDPSQWSDFRASVQFRWSAGSVTLQIRRASTGNQISISLDRSTGTRVVAAVINGTQTVLKTDTPDFPGPDTDIQLMVDCVGEELHVVQTDAPAINLTLPPGAPAAGTLGFLASGAAGCRFTEIRVDDLRSNPATAQRFDFVTSRYANFAHHIASFDDQVLNVPASLGVTVDDLNDHLSAAVTIPAGGPLGFGPGTVTPAETRAFDALELAAIGTDGRLRPPPAVEVLRASRDPAVTALLIRSPEPFRWERTRPVVSVPASGPRTEIPSDVKMVAVSFSSVPADERVTLVVRAGLSLTGFVLQWRHVVDASNPEPQWTSYFTFGREEALGEGTAVLVSSGSPEDAPDREPGSVQRFVAEDAATATVHFPDDGSGVELRLLDGAGVVVHQREFQPDGGSSQQIETRIIRKLDGTALFLFLPPEDGSSPPAGMRIVFTFMRNLGGSSTEPVLRQAGSETPEVALLDFKLS